ncbi:serine/threonine-protein kinase [Nonomuraea pusilla]|uniref:serine/threonine-protein kinase n=1 Tax=Nonomuraea pusilla TaxID=46177 RepID=UPI0015A5FE88|nr:serine/threonine-protein kinase [Nonomuraea pusilla]
MDLVPGYREVRQLGAGRTGRVFLATYQATGAYVAIKYLSATLRRDAEFMDRFRTATHTLVEIDDPRVVRCYEYVETRSRAAVVMELVDGVPLRALLDEHGRTSPEAALALLKDALLALAAAHGKGVAHRDVTPGNLLVQADGAAKLADFGVAVHPEEPGAPAGSPPYMAPELWTRGLAGPPADLYAAACVLFESVRGRPPYRADDLPALRDGHLAEPVPLEVVPDALRDLLRRGLAKDPASRYASAEEFAAELEEDAAAGYGEDWEKRGRRHLAEQATALALRFPLAATGQDGPGAGRRAARTRERVLALPRLPPHLWIAAATVVAAAVALVASGGRLPPGPGTILLPQPEPSSQREPGTGDEAGARPPGSRDTASARPPGRQDPDPARPPGTRDTAPARPPGAWDTAPARPPGTQDTAPSRPDATEAPTRRPGASPSATGPAHPSPTSPVPGTPRPSSTPPGSGGAVPPPAVRSAGILRWSGSAGTVRVVADGPGPVRVRVAYTRREGDAPATTVRREELTLHGDTAYTADVRYEPGDVPCGTVAYAGIVVMTEPAAANGPQVSEAPLTTPTCPPPTTAAPATSPQAAPASPQATPAETPSASSGPDAGTSWWGQQDAGTWRRHPNHLNVGFFG